MHSQAKTHPGPHVAHLLQFVLLCHLAIVADSIKVPSHEKQDREKPVEVLHASTMICARLRSRSLAGCSPPIHLFSDEVSRRSRFKELRNWSNGDEKLVTSSTSLKSKRHRHVLSSPPPDISSTLSSSDSALSSRTSACSTSTTSSSQTTRLLMNSNVLKSSYAGQSSLHNASSKVTQQRVHQEHRFRRRIAHLLPRTGHVLEHQQSWQLLEERQFLVNDRRPTINDAHHDDHWKSPLVETGPVVRIRVAQGGASAPDFSLIQQAIDSIPDRNLRRVIICIHAGTYREKVVLPYQKPFITFEGDENGYTIITWNDTASSTNHRDTKYARTKNASAALFGTMQSASVTILSDSFVAKNIAFQNSAPAPEPGAVGAQAVAFLIAGDRAAFYNCSFLGAQDTLYDYSGRHYYMSCYIQGSIDFIFGNGRSLFEECALHSIATSFGAIAAHQRLSREDDTGFSFHRCIVTGSGLLYLGRAWSPYARIIFARTYFDNIVFAEGWSDFGDPHRQRTTFFGEYQCTGPGANLSHRAPWSKLLNDSDVRRYLTLDFVNGKDWLGTMPFRALQNKTRT